MKKILMTAILFCTITVSAQEDGEHQSSAQTDRNRTYRITLGNVQYAHHDEKMSAGFRGARPLVALLWKNVERGGWSENSSAGKVISYLAPRRAQRNQTFAPFQL